MKKTKRITINERDFIYTCSDENRYVVRDGVEYREAYDPAELGREYTEGDLIPTDPEDTAAKAEAYDILMGVES